jgi:signal transduction histidine kinase
VAIALPVEGGSGGLARAPTRVVSLAIVVGSCAAAGAAMVLALTSDHVAEPGLQGALMVWVGLPYVLSGVVAWWRRPDSRLGPLMVIAGFVTFLATLQWTDADVPHTVGQAADLLPAVLFLHVFLAFPSGRLRNRRERGLVGSAYGIAVGLDLLEVVGEPGAAGVLEQVQLVALAGICLIGIGTLVGRRRSGGRPLRPSAGVLIDSFMLGLLMVALLLGVGAFDGPGFEMIRRVTFGVVGVAPVAFLAGLLSARLARAAVGDLVVELRGESGTVDLRAALARALRDPSLTLAYWLPEFGRWADGSGHPVALPEGDVARAISVIDSDGIHVAALVHDASLRDEPELLDGVSAVAGIALENARLHADLNARVVELRGSRQRVIEAGRKERERLERNLHDGAQQRLIALSLELRLLQDRLAAHPEARGGLTRARHEIATSLGELRDIARGLHPAVVTAHGLPVALESLAARACVPVRLTVRLENRLPEGLEVTAYYLVCESLANIGKHARATCATIDVARLDGRVVVEVADDGVGGADSERGTGLRGIADRVESLGGRLLVWTPRGRGTRVRAEIPCA